MLLLRDREDRAGVLLDLKDPKRWGTDPTVGWLGNILGSCHQARTSKLGRLTSRKEAASTHLESEGCSPHLPGLMTKVEPRGFLCNGKTPTKGQQEDSSPVLKPGSHTAPRGYCEA